MLEHNYPLSQSMQTIGALGRSELWGSKWAVTRYKLDLKKNSMEILNGFIQLIQPHCTTFLHLKKKISAHVPSEWQKGVGASVLLVVLSSCCA